MDGKSIANMVENLLKIFDRQEVILALKKHWIANHENLTNPERFVEEFFAFLLEKRQKSAPNAKEIKKFYNKKLEEYRKGVGGAEKPKDMFLEIVDRELDGTSTILDFGCGKLAFMKELAENNRSIRKFIGVDPKSQPFLDGLDQRIVFERDLSRVARESVDLAVIKLVLHHLEDESGILDIFKKIKNVLRSSGKLVIFEESFPGSDCDAEETRDYLAGFNMEMSEVTEDFLRLSEEDKKNFLFLNDWLMNVQNDYMPWTGQYKSMEEWKKLIKSVGFAEEESHFLGAIKHRKRKQGMTAYMVFRKE